MKSTAKGDEPQQLPLSPDVIEFVRRPSESATSEGNLAELPIWVLNSKQARPALEHDYSKTVDLGTALMEDGRSLQRTVTITASPKYGFPTMFAYRVLLAVLQEGRSADSERRRRISTWDDARIQITRHRIARLLSYASPSAKDLDFIENACHAMLTTRLELNGTWYDREKKARAHKHGTTLLADVNLDPARAQRALPGMEKSESDSSVTLGPVLFKSLQDGYFNGIDLDYLNALRSPLAQRCYIYLTKMDGIRSNGAKKATHSEGIQKIAAKFDLKKRKPSALIEDLAPALDQLVNPLKTARDSFPRRFLERWNIDRPKQMLTVVFFDEEQGRVRALADASLREAKNQAPGASQQPRPSL